MTKKIKKDPKDWTTNELFIYLQTVMIIAPGEKVEDWESSREELIEIVKAELKSIPKS